MVYHASHAATVCLKNTFRENFNIEMANGAVSSVWVLVITLHYPVHDCHSLLIGCKLYAQPIEKSAKFGTLNLAK